MKEINTNEFDNELRSNEIVIVDFFSTECPPCEALAPKLESIEKLVGNEVHIVKIYRQGNRDLAEKLNVKSSPTLLFYKNGEEIAQRLSGGIKRSEIIRTLKLILGKDRLNSLLSGIEPIVTETDVAILGAGPGGLTAGLYLCQAKIDATLIDINLPGGNVSTTHQVSNYPGFIEPQPGYLLSHNMSEQTKKCGTTYKVAVDVTKVNLETKEITIDEFETIKAKKIIIATGTSPNRIGIPGELEFKGQGISYCATCDAKYFADKEVIVIGGGNSAVEEADFISKFASKVFMIHQFDKFQANKQAQEKILSNPKFSFLFEHEPRAFIKDGNRMIVEVQNLKTKDTFKLSGDGVFVFIGLKPNIDLFKNNLELDQWGYIITDEDKRTSIKDVYAVGDVTSKKYRQITTAIADGTIAAISITRELDN